MFCLPLLFLPKINFISFEGRETAGIRIDDIFLVVLALVVFWAHFALHKKFYDIEKWMCLLVGFSLFSFVINRLLVYAGILQVDAVVFYAIRIFEYFIFFYIGLFSSFFVSSSKVIKLFFAWNIILILLQKFGIIGQFSNWGYLQTSTERVSGIGSFPSETGLFLNMVFCYLIYDDVKPSKINYALPPVLSQFFQKTYIYWLFLICALAIILTGSRIAIIALVVTFFCKLINDFNWRSISSNLLAIIFIAIGSVFMTFLILKNEAIFQRSAGLLSFKNLELIKMVWDNISIDYDPIGYEAVKFDSYDMSWWMRIHKWIYSLKIYVLNPECWLQGIGPGFAMAGLDGGYLRILVEYGIIGSLLFWKLFSLIYHKSTQLKWMMVAFLINMIFFDVYLAYKPMSLLFFIAGYAYSKNKIPEQLNNKLLTNTN